MLWWRDSLCPLLGIQAWLGGCQCTSWFILPLLFRPGLFRIGYSTNMFSVGIFMCSVSLLQKLTEFGNKNCKWSITCVIKRDIKTVTQPRVVLLHIKVVSFCTCASVCRVRSWLTWRQWIQTFLHKSTWAGIPRLVFLTLTSSTTGEDHSVLDIRLLQQVQG